MRRRAGRGWVYGAVVAAVAAGPLCGQAGEGRPGRPGERPEVQIRADLSVLPKGAVCEVELRSKETGTWRRQTTTYVGSVLEAAEEGVRLAVTEERHRSRTQLPPLLNAVPGLGRHFNHSGELRAAPPEGREEARVAVQEIAHVRVLATPEPLDPGEVTPVSYDDPADAGAWDESRRTVVHFAEPRLVPVGAECLVEGLRDGKEAAFIGRVAAVDETTLTLEAASERLLDAAAAPSPEARAADAIRGGRALSSGVVVDEPVAPGTEVRFGTDEISQISVLPAGRTETRRKVEAE